MVKEIESIPEDTRMNRTKKTQMLDDVKEVVEKGWKFAELIPPEYNEKYPQNVTERYRWAARCCSKNGIVVTVIMKRDDEKKPHWYATVKSHGEWIDGGSR